jgi:uncharacterized protein (TIGR02452 family)
MNQLHIVPCLDSDEIADSRRKELSIPRGIAADLGRSAVEAAREGEYINGAGQRIIWRDAVQAAIASKLSIAPEDSLPKCEPVYFAETRIHVTNETTLGASQTLVERGLRPLALNFANGVNPGGGFLHGARAQEEVLCRSSALYLTLVGDPMYSEHQKRPLADSTEWAILSPDVPVFREDNGAPLEKPWLLSFITCAAPYAPTVGQPASAEMLKRRIHRVLATARAFGYETIVLGAWGCGAFENDPERTANDFRQAIETEFRGAFSNIVFAITDWSPERKFLGPFRDAFATEDPLKMAEDPFCLHRFVVAQENIYSQALDELRSGHKHTHWMWFVFPQFEGLASSETARFYAIRSAEEATAYLHHPTLGPRLVECCEAILAVEGKTANDILGFPDDLKLRSCATLFSAVSKAPAVYTGVIDKFFSGHTDRRTLELLRTRDT